MIELIIGLIIGILILGVLFVRARLIVLAQKRQLEALQSSVNYLHKSIKHSKATRTGLAVEQLVPWVEGFPFHPSDMKFLGAPIDYIVFDGMHKDEIEKVVIIEVKSASSNVTKREKQIGKCINEGKVEFLVYRLERK